MPTTGLGPNNLSVTGVAGTNAGTLSYNGVVFSVLYQSKLSGDPVKDEADRTTKYVRYTLQVEGVVTLEANQSTTDVTWKSLRERLSQTGQALNYSGNGSGGIVVNQPGGSIQDIAWGPKPKILAMQPWGGARASLIRWEVIVTIPELPPDPLGKLQGVGDLVCQWNWECSVRYDEEGYSYLHVEGTLEIPLSRNPGVNQRVVNDTVDSFRQRWLNMLFDLAKFKVTNRTFNYNRDKRICNWSFDLEELAPMGLPPQITSADGDFDVSPMKQSVGGVSVGRWAVNLSATYTLTPNFPRRVSAWAFYSLLWFRMWSSVNGVLPAMNDAQGQQQPNPNPLFRLPLRVPPAPPAGAACAQYYEEIFRQRVHSRPKPNQGKALLVNFGFREGVYNGSKKITYRASWVLFTNLASLLLATGVWRSPQEVGGLRWAFSMQNIMGWKSWLRNAVDPTADAIVDLGGGTPPQTEPIRGF